jgi:hypothetical protein
MSCFSATPTTARVGELNPTKHVNYNLGMVLGVADFTQEHAYLSGRDHWMVRDLVGYGTVRGLRIDNEVDAVKGPRIAVQPGVAVSPRGQLICVPTAQCAYLKDWIEQHSEELLNSPQEDVAHLYIVLCYRECPSDNVPISGEPCRSEDQLVAPSRWIDDFSLELRLKPPNQREENAVRDFVDWLKQIDVTDTVVSSTPLDQFLKEIRAAAGEWFGSPLSSPPGDFMAGSPPAFIHIRSDDLSEYLSAAFRIWVTELRPKWIARWHGCAPTHFETDVEAEEDCVMLAEVVVPIVLSSPGNFTVADNPPVIVNEQRRPYLIHLRMLQEWLLRGGRWSTAPASSKSLTITNVGAGTVTLTNLDQCVICDVTAGNVTINLPTVAGNHGQVFFIKRLRGGGANTCTVNRVEADLIEGQTSVSLGQNKAIQIVANEPLSAWHIVGSV